MKKYYTEVDGYQIHYRASRCGDGIPLAVLHMSGSSSDEFEGWEAAAEGRYRIFAPDIPGLGSSDPVPEPDMDRIAGVLASWIESLKVGPVILFGNMAGANLAAAIACTYPDRIRELWLCSPVYLENREEFLGRAKLPCYAPVEAVAAGSHLAEYWRRADRYGASPEMVMARVRNMIMAGEHSEMMHRILYQDPRYEERLRNIPAATRVIGLGQVPFVFRKEHAEELIPGAEYYWLPDGDPYITRRDPRRILAVGAEDGSA